MDVQLREELVRSAHTLDHEGELITATHSAMVRNPLCGDELHFRLLVDSTGRVSLARTQVRGCLITSAASHAMAKQIEGLSYTQAFKIAQSFLAMLNRQEERPLPGELSKFKIFCSPHPRKSCAALPAQALLSALPCVEN